MLYITGVGVLLSQRWRGSSTAPISRHMYMTTGNMLNPKTWYILSSSYAKLLQ